MDYEIGSIADLISGSLTPNRPKLTKRAITPVKQKLSPNVTPKSCSNVIKGDFLSPSIQKKKEVTKRTPKRIFQKIEGVAPTFKGLNGNKSGTARNFNDINSTLNTSAAMNTSAIESGEAVSPKKEKKKKSTENLEITGLDELTGNVNSQESKSPQQIKQNKKRKKNYNVSRAEESSENLNQSVEEGNDTTTDKPQELSSKPEPRKANKRKFKASENGVKEGKLVKQVDGNETKAKKKNNKKKSKQLKQENISFQSESEHESDNDMASETEEEFNNILKETTINKDGGDSSDDEQNDEKKKIEKESKTSKAQTSRPFVVDETELQRTLFVGNVPISKKTKKDVKKLFKNYGDIESVRIRTIPVKDMYTSPKVALLTNKIHPERSTVNVYVKFVDASSVDKALVENNTLMGDKHLRVTRSNSSGEYDPRKTLFVGNMPFNMEDDVLRALFEKCGSIDSVRIIRDRKLQIGKGFGYVNFTKADGVELGLNLSEEDLTINSRVLRVKRYNLISGKGKDKLPRHQTKRPGSGPGRGGFHQRPRGGYARGPVQRSQKQTGAFRRINNKNQQTNLKGDKEKTFENKGKFSKDQPKEKKSKKEFVGLTAEKKKPKKKFNKDEKKKRQLSEILTKKRDK